MFNIKALSLSLLIRSIDKVHLRTLSTCSKLRSESFTTKDKANEEYVSKEFKTEQKWTKSPYKIKQLRFSKHIVNLVAKGKVSEAVEVFESMKNNKVKAEVVVYNALIAGYGRTGNAEASFKVFNQMKKHGLLPTDHTYTSMLSACAEAGPKADTILAKVESEIERREVHLNTIATNALIKALASCRQQKHALQAYLDMVKVGNTPDVRTYSNLLQAGAKDETGGVLVSQRVWEEMTSSGHQPDMHSFNLLLQCIRDAGLEGTQTSNCEEVIRVPKLNLPQGSVVSAVSSRDEAQIKSPPICVKKTGSFVVFLSKAEILTVNFGSVATKAAYGSAIRWLEQTEQKLLMESLKRLNLKPDIRLFHLLLQLSLSSGEVLALMEECGVKPDTRALLSAVRIQARLGSVARAKAVLRHSLSLGEDLGQAGYQAVASCSVRQEDGLQLLAEMKEAKCVPNERVFETLIGNAVRTRNYVYLTALIKKMRHFEVLPSDTLIGVLETVVNQKPKSVHMLKQLNGFKGYYSIWKKGMVKEQ